MNSLYNEPCQIKPCSKSGEWMNPLVLEAEVGQDLEAGLGARHVAQGGQRQPLHPRPVERNVHEQAESFGVLPTFTPTMWMHCNLW